MFQFIMSIADAGRALLKRNETSGPEVNQSISELCRDLMSTKGEASGTALAREITYAYAGLSAEEKLDFFNVLANDFGVDKEEVILAARAFEEDQGGDNLSWVGRAAEPERQELFRRINMAPSGTEVIVNLREDLLSLLKQYPELKVVDTDLQHLLSSWFNRGFLSLERVDWNTSASILEKIIHYESVHAIQGWDDLHRRLQSDRRCFAYFHPAMTGEPLIFVEVALVNGLSNSIQVLLDQPLDEASEKPDTAIFYSINNCHRGLKGISFGNFLIKHVVSELVRDFPEIEYYSTLSPVPGFRRWLKHELESDNSAYLSGDDRSLLSLTEEHDWAENDEQKNRSQPLLMKLCSHYLLDAKRRNMPVDAVARFHLRNGARLERLNWAGDVSDNGIAQSYGILCNYLYDLDSIEKNHEEFVSNGVIDASDQVKSLRLDNLQGKSRSRLH